MRCSLFFVQFPIGPPGAPAFCAHHGGCTVFGSALFLVVTALFLPSSSAPWFPLRLKTGTRPFQLLPPGDFSSSLGLVSALHTWVLSGPQGPSLLPRGTPTNFLTLVVSWSTLFLPPGNAGLEDAWSLVLFLPCDPPSQEPLARGILYLTVDVPSFGRTPYFFALVSPCWRNDLLSWSFFFVASKRSFAEVSTL